MVKAAVKLLKKQNRLFNEGQYEQAEQHFIQLIDNGVISTELYFNLANVYAEMGNVGYALLWYERAHRRSPNNENIMHNMNLVSNQQADSFDEIQEMALIIWWKRIASIFSTSTWSILALVLFTSGNVWNISKNFLVDQ